MSLKRTPDGVTFASNGHAVWTDTASETDSPWIGLRSFNDRRPIFRNLRIVGGDVPSQVDMIRGNTLRGWFAGYFDQRAPTPLPADDRVSAFGSISTSEYDWLVRDDILHGGRRGTGIGAPIQSRITYSRPLLNGESVDYEFLYDPDHYLVHPVIGRLAFELTRAGVRLHWLTDGDREWTGLPNDNTVVEPLNRLTRTLPLKPGEWNRVSVSLADGAITLTLNAVDIYRRDHEPSAESTFGFYHDPTQSAARVRNVVMRGDWPEPRSRMVRSNAGTERSRASAFGRAHR